jgi:hypothetical protein
MIARCERRHHKSYKNYGARGITVCVQWHDFHTFLADMRERPLGTTLDRIDNDGNYEPGNCRWAVRLQQDRNRRNNTLLTHQGRTLPMVSWSEATGIDKDTIGSRLRRGWSVEDALTFPADMSASISRYRQRQKEAQA